MPATTNRPAATAQDATVAVAWLVRLRRYDRVASLIWLSLSEKPARSKPLDGASISRFLHRQETRLSLPGVERGLVSKVPGLSKRGLLPRPALGGERVG